MQIKWFIYVNFVVHLRQIAEEVSWYINDVVGKRGLVIFYINIVYIMSAKDNLDELEYYNSLPDDARKRYIEANKLFLDKIFSGTTYTYREIFAMPDQERKKLLTKDKQGNSTSMNFLGGSKHKSSRKNPKKKTRRHHRKSVRRRRH